MFYLFNQKFRRDYARVIVKYNTGLTHTAAFEGINLLGLYNTNISIWVYFYILVQIDSILQYNMPVST